MRSAYLAPIFALALAAGMVPVARAGETPTVTLDQPAPRSNDTTPSFSGTASDTTLVTVDVYEGESAQGPPIAILNAQGNGGSWASASVSSPLENGIYTAIATQPSLHGSGEGVSNSVKFEVDTEPPTVTLTAPSSPSNDTTPSFSGTASEATQVTVKIFEGSQATGKLVATAAASPSGGRWTSSAAVPALGNGTFTAVASQPSAIENGPGKSAPVTFVVDTQAPKVTLNAPQSPSNDTVPSFSGTASEATPVTVEIFEGLKAVGRVLATATATGSAGNWSSGDASPALGNGTFTAVASQPSAIENGPGKSAPVTFVVDTESPAVALNALPSPSGNAAPSFSGTASDDTPVTVQIHEGASAGGAVVASVTAEAHDGEWVSGRLNPSLAWGEYTAVATQPSSLGNPSGASSPVTFVLEPIPPTVATEGASQVTRSSAALYASVDPDGGGVSACYFEYGTSLSYGESVECGFVSEIAAFPPSGTVAVAVFARIYGLHPSTSYHFRIVTVGEGGVGVGTDETFTTQPPYAFGLPGSSGKGLPALGGSGMSAARVAALIAKQLARLGRRARIGALLKRGLLKAPFKAPEAGTARIDWYYLPPAARHAGLSARSPVPLASGVLRFPSAGTAAFVMRLTGAGSRLLRDSRRVPLAATCVFSPVGAPSVRTSAKFELRR